MIDRTPTVPELQRITELANEYRRQLMADLVSEFPERDASAAMAVALAIMFTTSMTPDPARQSDQARILNEILSRWQPVLPWQLVRRANNITSRRRHKARWACCPVAFRLTPGSCHLMDAKITRPVALVALIYASGTGSALCDLCPARLLDGTLTIPDTATLQLKASTNGDAALTGPLGAISGRATVTCQAREFNAMLYGMSDGSLYRCRATINGQRFTGHCVIGSVTGEISGRFLAQP